MISTILTFQTSSFARSPRRYFVIVVWLVHVVPFGSLKWLTAPTGTMVTLAGGKAGVHSSGSVKNETILICLMQHIIMDLLRIAKYLWNTLKASGSHCWLDRTSKLPNGHMQCFEAWSFPYTLPFQADFFFFDQNKRNKKSSKYICVYVLS